MYLAAYHFDGDPDQLEQGYERMIAGFPPAEIMLNLSVRRDGGISVYDACNTEADFRSFSTSDEFTGAIKAAGLPAARIEALGDVRASNGTLVGSD